jgi:hypothetical protein
MKRILFVALLLFCAVLPLMAQVDTVRGSAVANKVDSAFIPALNVSRDFVFGSSTGRGAFANGVLSVIPSDTVGLKAALQGDTLGVLYWTRSSGNISQRDTTNKIMIGRTAPVGDFYLWPDTTGGVIQNMHRAVEVQEALNIINANDGFSSLNLFSTNNVGHRGSGLINWVEKTADGKYRATWAMGQDVVYPLTPDSVSPLFAFSRWTKNVSAGMTDLWAIVGDAYTSSGNKYYEGQMAFNESVPISGTSITFGINSFMPKSSTILMAHTAESAKDSMNWFFKCVTGNGATPYFGIRYDGGISIGIIDTAAATTSLIYAKNARSLGNALKLVDVSNNNLFTVDNIGAVNGANAITATYGLYGLTVNSSGGALNITAPTTQPSNPSNGHTIWTKTGGANVDTLLVLGQDGSQTQIFPSPILPAFWVGLIDSVKTTDTVAFQPGYIPLGTIIDDITYSNARGAWLTVRISQVDSLFQTSGTTLIDTASVITQKLVHSSAVSGGTFTLTVGKMLRFVVASIGVMPKQFNATIRTHRTY